MPRVVRKLEYAARPTFDEQLWPINSLLVVLSGIAAGVIIGTSDFDTPVVWRNGWARIASLVGSVGLLLYVANRVRGSVGRRFQLAALVSLIVHVAAGILLYQQYLDSFVPEQIATGSPPRSAAIQFEYQPRLADEGTPQQLHERPVETQAVAEREIAIERAATTTLITIEAPPTPVPERETAIEPSMLQMQRNEFAAARRAAAESRLSRSMADAPSQQSDQVSAPQAQAVATNTPAQPEAQTAAIERRQSTETARVESVDTPTTVEVARDVTQPARRAADEPQPAAASTAAPTLERAVAQAAEVPRAAAEEPSAFLRVESEQPRELSVNTSLARQQTASPVVRQSTTEITASVTPSSAEVAQSATARQTSETRPDVARTDPSNASRSLAQATQQADQALESPAAASAPQSDTAPSPAGPAATSVARTSSAAPASPSSAPASDGSLSSSDPAVAQAASSPRRAEGAPGLSATANAARPGRATAAADSAASPAAIENPTLAGSPAAAAAPSAEPAATSLTRSTDGTSGRGRSANLDTGLSAPATNAQTASAASRRAASSTESGPSVAASAPALARGSRAQAAISSASAQADDAPDADTRGGAVASPLEASSGAAVARAGSSAPRSTTAAGQGTMSLDTGAPQVVSRAGSGRGDGGGQPTVAGVATTGQPARAATSEAPISSIAADAVADAPRAPAGAAGGEQSPAASLTAQRGGGDRTSASTSAPAASNIADGAATNLVAQPTAATGSAPSRGAEAQPSAPPTGAATGPQRATSSPFTANTQADDVQVASAPQPRGGREGSPLEASVAGASRQPSGLPGRTTTSAAGAIAGETAIGAPLSSNPGAVAASRADSREGTSRPAVTDLAGGAPLARATAVNLPNLVGDAADVADPTANAAPGTINATGDNAPGPSSGPVARSTSSGVPVQLAAAPGPGGLGVEIAAAIGSRKPQSTRDSLLIHNDDARFRGRQISGAVPVEGFVREAARGFERPGIEGGTGRGQQNAKTEEAIERGLDFLVRAQQEDGSWSFQHFPGATEADIGVCRSDSAATGLALLAFLGAGYDHFDDKHRHVVRRGLRYLVDQQKESGDLYTFQEKESHKAAWLYSHAIAAIALSEAYGMTGDDELAGPAQRAIDFIETSQNAQFGGWRYAPGGGADTSVTGWQLMALKSGDLAGLKVKPETYEGVRRWLDFSQKSPDDGSQYVYNAARGSNQEQSDVRRPTMTSVGLLMRLYLGWDRTREEMQRGAQHMLDYPPLYGTTRSRQRDTYYWYYATQVMFHMKGDYWRRWHGQLYPLLIGMQARQGPMAGSWDPGGDSPDRWAGQGGRIYVTTMNLLSLEVYYRHLPLYESTAR